MKKMLCGLCAALLAMLMLVCLCGCLGGGDTGGGDDSDPLDIDRPDGCFATECLLLAKRPVYYDSAMTGGSDSIAFEKLFGNEGESGIASSEAIHAHGANAQYGNYYLVCLIYGNEGLPSSADTLLETSFSLTCLSGTRVLHDGEGFGVDFANVYTWGDVTATLDMSLPEDERLRVKCTEVGLKDGEIEGAIVIPLRVTGGLDTDCTFYIEMSVRGFGARSETIDSEDVVCLGRGSIPQTAYIGDFSVRYLTEANYNGGNYADTALTATPSFEGGKAAYMVLDMEIRTTQDNTGGREVKVIASVPQRNAMSATIEEAPTGKIEETLVDGVTTIYASYSILPTALQSKTVRMIIRLLPISGGTVDLDLFIVGDENTGVDGNVHISTTLETGSPALGFTLSEDGSHYILSALNDPNMTEVTVPDAMGDGLPVAAFAETLFKGNTKLQRIKLGDGIKRIPTRAFSGCTALTEISIGKGVEIIDPLAFENCKALQYTTHGNAKYLGSAENPYAYLVEVIDKTATEFTIPATTRIIGDSAFYDCDGLTSITIPNGVTDIGNKAFQTCGYLRSITIPESVKAIGHNAFLACSRVGAIYYNAIEVADSNVGTEIFSGVGFDLSVNGAAIHIGAKVKRIPKYLFDGENFWTKGVTFADGCVCEVIAEGAFLGAFGMSSVIPVSVKEIGSYAFFSGKKPDYYDTIQYAGTMSQWGQIKLGSAWNGATVKIKCSDGTIGG